MASHLEEIISRLLVADNDVIQQATQELKKCFNDPNFVQSLCQILATSQNLQVRQYAAVLLRKKILKGKQWAALQGTFAQTIRENILQLLLQEPEKIVRIAIAQVIATAAKHDLPTNAWPQLFAFISQNVKGDSPQQRELGMYLLYSVASAAAEQLKPHLADIAALVSGVLSGDQGNLAPFYAIKTLSEVVFFVGDDALKTVQKIVPQILEVIKNLITVDQEKACEAFEVFDEMLECEVVMITPHIKSTVMFCLEIAGNSELDDSIRIKAMSFICSLTRLRKKQIQKNQLVLPILNVMFPVMCETSDEDDEDEDEEEVESQRPSQLASQVLDTMAMHLPPEKFIPPVMSMVEPALQDGKPERRKAAYIALAVVVEGCADFITNKHLQAVLQCVCKGLGDPEQMVRNGALFAMGQFSEHLQPDISKYASEVLPLLFQYLLQVSQDADKNQRGLTRSYYALEMFCQNLGKDIEPYLPKLMEHLMTVLKTSTTLRPKELAISAIGATASAAEKLICPYFEEIIQQFRGYLVVTEGNEEMFKLQIQTIDTLGVLARCVGAEMFQPLTRESVQFGLNLLNTAEDPDQRRCIYGLFAALSTLLKGDIAEYLQTMMHFMLLSLRSNEGVKAHVKEESSFLFDDAEFDAEVDIEVEEQEEDGDMSDIAGISVENSYMEEKEDTAMAMGEIALNAGTAFLPYLEESYQELLSLLEYPASRVKKGAVSALGQYCVCVHEVAKAGHEVQNSQVALMGMLNTLVPKFLTIISEDDDREVVMSTVDVIHDILEKIGQPVLQVPEATDQILTKMKLIFIHKVACQCGEEAEEEEDEQAEFDGMLIESAGDVIPVMAKLVGGENFLAFFAGFLPDLLKRMRQTSSTAEKSFAVGTLGETIDAVGPSISMYAETLYPVFIKMIRDEDDEVRSNSVYSLGVLMSICAQKLHGHIPEVLKLLFGVLGNEKNGRVIDNVCAATCRLTLASPAQVPVDVVTPVIIKCLPLKEDQEENLTVYRCLTHLYSQGNQQVITGIPEILKAIASCLGTDKFKPEVEKLTIDFVKDVAGKYPEAFRNLKTSLTPDMSAKLDTCLSAVNGHCVNGNS
ncbi:importin-4-like [Mya arenaria]|uniref:importin-4-like n=1 Tax=Mya arenaria TaxID=6604 RepID=UPI0022E71C9F|nr:importin-4-like [Mya arenaria]